MRVSREHPGQEPAADPEADHHHVARALAGVAVDRRRRRPSRPPAQPGAGHRRRGGGQARRDQHGQHRRRQEELVAGAVEQAVAATDLHQHERELADLRQPEADRGHRAHRVAERRGRGAASHRLGPDDHRRQPEHQRPALGGGADVDQHADRDEEDAGEDVAERRHVGEHLVAVLGLRDQEPGDEGAQGEREAERVGRPGEAQADRERAEHEQLAAARAHDEVEEPRHQEPGGDHHQHHRQERAAEAERQRAGRRRHRAAEDRGEHDHRHDQEVLVEEDRERHLAVRGLRLAPLVEQLQDDRGAREGDHHAEEDRLRGHEAVDRGAAGDQRQGERRLERAAEQERPPHLAQPGERQLEADDEEEEDDADLGEELDRLGVVDQAERGGADQHPGHEQPDQRRQAQPVADQHHQHRGAEDRDRLLEEVPQFHGRDGIPRYGHRRGIMRRPTTAAERHGPSPPPTAIRRCSTTSPPWPPSPSSAPT